MQRLRTRILGAPDELTSRLEGELHRGGFTIEVLPTSEDAATDGARGETPDLVLVSDADLERPLPDLVAELAGEDDPPLIVVCAPEREDQAIAAMQFGARDYVLSDRLARLCPTIRRELAEAANRRQQRQAEAAERQRMLLVEVLRDTASALSSTLDLDEVFDRILAAMGWVIPHNTAAIFFAEGNAARVVRLRGWEDLGIDSVPDRVHLTEVELAALSAMMASGKPIVIQDTREDSRWAPGDRRLHWVRSFAAAPLFDESKVFGVLALFSDQPTYFTDVHLELLEGFASQAAMATRNARLFEAVSTSRRRLRELSTRIVDAQEDERRRISQELHDGVAQTLTGVIINTELLINQMVTDGEDPFHSRLSDVAALAKQSLQQIRTLSHRLRPAILDELGLASTLRWFTGRYSKATGAEIELAVTGLEETRPGQNIETALYRVVQEVLAWLARQGRATRVSIELASEPDAVILTISDNSPGGPTSNGEVTDVWTEVEVLGIEERILSVGGELEISASESGSFHIAIRIPIGVATD